MFNFKLFNIKLLKKSTLIAILCLFQIVNSCEYEERNITNYSSYYDEKHEHLKMKGTIINGNEEGEWNYFDEKGNLVQSGAFENGFFINEWNYKFPYMDTVINWKRISTDEKVEFSLPSHYYRYKNTGVNTIYMAVDSFNNEMIAISLLSNRSKAFMDSLFLMNIDEIGVDNNIDSCKSSVIKGKDLLYYFDEYSISTKAKEKINFKMFMLYTYCDNKIIIFNISTRNKRRDIAKFLIGEIFNHSKLNGKKIVNPLTNIDEIEERY
jgi:hypothetical protein